MTRIHLKIIGDGWESHACQCYCCVEKTTNPLEVTCKNCQRTTAYKSAMEKLNNESEETEMEASYVERQNAWIKENDIRVGDRVRIIRVQNCYDEGWQNSWTYDLNKYVSTIGTIIDIAPQDMGCGVRFEDERELYFPYYELEKVTETTPSLVEIMTDAELTLKKLQEMPDFGSNLAELANRATIEKYAEDMDALTEPKKVDLMAQLEEICGEGWVHTMVDNSENGHLIISEAIGMDRPYFNLHTLDYGRTTLDTIVINGIGAMERLRDILDKQVKEYKGKYEN